MSLPDHTLFILGTTKFDNIYESTSFTVAKYLAKGIPVYYIENPFTWKDYFRYKGTPEFKRRQKYFSSHSDGVIQTDIPNLKIIITPPLLSINFLPEGTIYRLLLKINEKIILKRIKKIIKANQINNFIYINSFNFHYPNVIKEMNAALNIYHCVDPLILPFDRKHGIISEQILVKNCDVVICTSKQLYLEKKKYNQKTFFIPNAADITHSEKALNSQLAIHESIADLPQPIIGYLGHIERRFDFDLIKNVVEKNPDKSFVFAGPTSPEFIPEWFYNTPNIFLTGRFPYDQLPKILKGFDIAIIPFKKDEVSGTIFPLKLFEYLGAGKPVISTNFNTDLEEFTQGTVTFCNDSESFTAAIDENLMVNSPEKIRARLAIAKQNTWTNRVNEFAKLIELHIKIKASKSS